MKQLLFLLVTALFISCGGDDSEDAAKTLALYDSLSHGHNLKLDTIPTINLSSPEEPQVSVKLGKVCIEIPKVDRAPEVKYFKIDLHIQGDSISYFSCTASTGTINKNTKSLIQPGDTKTKIASRLGVKVSQIKNKEPLRVGQKIIIE